MDEDKLARALETKVDIAELKDLINRQNNLEAYVHNNLNQRGKTETDLTRET